MPWRIRRFWIAGPPLDGSRLRVSALAPVQSVAPAITASSLAPSLGFSSLLLSSWQSISSFGFLASIAIIVALVADLVVVPAVVCGLGPRKKAESLGRERARTA